MADSSDPNSQLQGILNRFQAGDAGARAELINHACERLRLLARAMLRGYPGLRRWEETDDVLNRVLLRLYKSLEEVKPDSVRAFLGLAATQIDRELKDLRRHHFGPTGLAANYASDPALGRPGAVSPVDARADSTPGPASQSEQAEKTLIVQGKIELLPEMEQEVVKLIYFQGLTHEQAGTVLGVSKETVKRRWASARVRLHAMLQDQVSHG